MSETTRPTVFVCGATGSQGGALAHQLRELDWNVTATVRDMETTSAQRLNSAGVKLVLGDWDNDEAIQTGVAGCDKLFLMLHPDFSDMTLEPRRAKRIVEAAKSAGVKQVVASTTLGVSFLEHPDSGITLDTFMLRHLVNKQAIEETVKNAGFEHWTFLRPSFLMANFLDPKVERYPEPRDKGTWTTAMTPDAQLALLDHADIAAFAVECFKQPTRFHDKSFNMASEFQTVQATLDILGSKAGRSFQAHFMTDEEITKQRESSNVFINSQVAMRHLPRFIDIDAINDVIRPTTFRDYLEKEGELVKKTYARASSQ